MAQRFRFLGLSAETIIPIRRLGLQFAPSVHGAGGARPPSFALNPKRCPARARAALEPTAA